jgi:hypothetical protein
MLANKKAAWLMSCCCFAWLTSMLHQHISRKAREPQPECPTLCMLSLKCKHRGPNNCCDPVARRCAIHLYVHWCHTPGPPKSSSCWFLVRPSKLDPSLAMPATDVSPHLSVRTVLQQLWAGPGVGIVWPQPYAALRLGPSAMWLRLHAAPLQCLGTSLTHLITDVTICIITLTLMIPHLWH